MVAMIHALKASTPKFNRLPSAASISSALIALLFYRKDQQAPSIPVS
jgi:hypothetical protein